MAGIFDTLINCFAKKPSEAASGAAPFRVVFVLGGPGSGKGTMCARVVEKYGWVHLSAGDLLRAERKDPASKNGALINEYIREGNIVPVGITLALIRTAMEQSGARNFLVDGFPRSADNLEGWEVDMAECADVASLLYLETTEAVMTERILRRSAETVAAGGAARSDDNAEAIAKRFATYHTSTMPIIEIFKGRNKVHVVDSTPAPDVVFACVCELFEKLGS